MKIYPLMRTKRRFWIDVPPEVFCQRLLDGVSDDAEMKGSASDGRFTLVRDKTARSMRAQNSWRPRLSGTYRPVSGGTVVDVSVTVDVFVFWFTVVHGLCLFGLAWLMGIVAFSVEVDKTMSHFREIVGASDTQPQLADPAAENAEERAPWSFAAHATIDVVRFALHSAVTRLGGQTVVELTVSRGGVTVHEQTIPWHRVSALRIIDGFLYIGDVEIDVNGHSAADLKWLMHYLHAQAHRRRASVEERETFAAQTRQFQVLRQDSTQK